MLELVEADGEKGQLEELCGGPLTAMAVDMAAVRGRAVGGCEEADKEKQAVAG